MAMKDIEGQKGFCTGISCTDNVQSEYNLDKDLGESNLSERFHTVKGLLEKSHIQLDKQNSMHLNSDGCLTTCR